jgi:hypothetical protein
VWETSGEEVELVEKLCIYQLEDDNAEKEDGNAMQEDDNDKQEGLGQAALAFENTANFCWGFQGLLGRFSIPCIKVKRFAVSSSLALTRNEGKTSCSYRITRPCGVDRQCRDIILPERRKTLNTSPPKAGSFNTWKRLFIRS